MTPERIKQLRDDASNSSASWYTVDAKEFAEIADSALRLAAIEAAGDEEVEKLVANAEGDNDCDCESCEQIRMLGEIAVFRGQKSAILQEENRELRALLKWCSPQVIRGTQEGIQIDKIIAESEVQGG